jgi:type IV pilus assembly protein PilA
MSHRSDRRGFTLIELLTVMVVIGVLASIALPKYQLFRRRAQAADVVASMGTIRTAAVSYSESTGSWPPSGGIGTVPAGLAPYLPGGFSFQNSDYSFGWTTFTMSLFGHSTTVNMVWMSTADATICQASSGLWGGSQNPDLISACGGNGGLIGLYVGH